MLKPIKIILITGVIVSIAILIFTIIAYSRSSLIHFTGYIDKDFFSAFGSFIGSTIGIVLSFVTVFLIFSTFQLQREQIKITRDLVERQLNLSIKPELIVQDFNNYYTNENETRYDDLIPYAIQNISLKIINIGIEAAQYIKYRFEFSIKDLNDFVIIKIQDASFEIDFKEGEKFFKIRKKNSEVEYFINGFSSKSLFFKDFLLPYKLEKSDLIIPFPYDYLVLYYLIFVELNKEKNSFDSQIKDFPKCIMHISYQNLEGTNYEKIFDLEIDYQGGTTLLNPEKITQFNLTIKSKIY